MGVGFDYILGRLRTDDQGPPGPPGPPPDQANVLAALEYYDEDVVNTPAVLPSAIGSYAVAIGDGALASGSYSAVSGGLNNTASGVGSCIGGGQQNIVSALNSVICGGNINILATAQSVICGGQANSSTISAGRTFIGAGASNETESADTFIGTGQNNEIENLCDSSVIITGSNNSITSGSIGAVILSGTDCEVAASTSYVVVSGKDALAHTSGMRVHATDNFSATGDQQVSDIILKAATTDATLTELNSNNSGSNTGITVRTNITMSFELHMTARRTAGSATVGDSMYRVIRGCVKDIGGVLSFVGNFSCDDQFEDAATAAWVITLSASAGKLQIEVTGEVGETIHWLCQAKLTEIG
jgi:hypothetical protein